MKVLVINCGRSTLKFQGLAWDEDTPPGGEKRLARGIVERIDSRGIAKCVDEKGPNLQETASVTDHGRATLPAFDWLEACWILENR